jgi:GTP-binding protein
MPAMKYLKSAVLPKDYPDTKRPEVAIAGRSNAGKSSFLNAVAGSKVAHVSQTPGKTRLLNFFDVGAHYRVVDMPGYGFAARAIDEKNEWSRMIETYLSMRGNLKGLVLLMDIRREWDEEEELLKQFCGKINLPICVLLTKIDKCSTKEKQDYLKKIKKTSQLSDVFLISAQTKVGIEEVEEFIYREWILAKPSDSEPT